MKHLTLQRTRYSENETLGTLMLEASTMPLLFTVERPWLNNKPRVSCIPKGTYRFAPHGWDPETKLQFKRVWQLLEVPDRSAILIHGGNTAKDVVGCIAVGKRQGKLAGHPAVLESQAALQILRQYIGNDGGTITIL